MRHKLLLGLATALAVHCGQATAQEAVVGSGAGGSGVVGRSPLCPRGTAFADGCSGAPVGANIQHPSFFTGYANQNAQTYATRPAWNVAGVDYAVGIPAATSLKDPTVNTLPTGCTLNAGTHVVTCSGAHGGLTFDGWDFGNAGGAGLCVRLVITGNVDGAIVIQNSNFMNSTGNGAQCNVSNGSLIVMNANSAASSVLVQDNVFDSNAQTVSYAPLNPALAVTMSNGQNVTVQYNAFLHSIARATQITTCGLSVLQFNYAEGFTYTVSQALHGELDEGNTYQAARQSRRVSHTTQSCSPLQRPDWRRRRSFTPLADLIM